MYKTSTQQSRVRITIFTIFFFISLYSNLIWDDTRISIEAISELRSFQRYNHFPAMSEISRKDALARNIMKLSKLLPYEYNFVPQTWILPNDFLYLCAYAAEMKKTHQKKTYILKPANGINYSKYMMKILKLI